MAAAVPNLTVRKLYALIHFISLFFKWDAALPYGKVNIPVSCSLVPHSLELWVAVDESSSLIGIMVRRKLISGGGPSPDKKSNMKNE